MAVVDFESAWFALKAHIQQKRSHGAVELAETMAEIETRYLLSELAAGYDDRPPARLQAVVSPSGDDPDAFCASG